MQPILHADIVLSRPNGEEEHRIQVEGIFMMTPTLELVQKLRGSLLTLGQITSMGTNLTVEVEFHTEGENGETVRWGQSLEQN